MYRQMAKTEFCKKLSDNKHERYLLAKAMFSSSNIPLTQMRLDACEDVNEIETVFGIETLAYVPFFNLLEMHYFLYGAVRRGLWYDDDAEYAYMVDYTLPYDHPYDRMHWACNWYHSEFNVRHYFDAIYNAKIYTDGTAEHEKAWSREERYKESAFYKQGCTGQECEIDNQVSYNSTIFNLLVDLIGLGMANEIFEAREEKRKNNNKKTYAAHDLHGYLCAQMHKYFRKNRHVICRSDYDASLLINIPEYVKERFRSHNSIIDGYEDFPSSFMYLKHDADYWGHEPECSSYEDGYAWFYNCEYDHDLEWHCCGCDSDHRLSYETVHAQTKKRKVTRRNISSDDRIIVYNRDGLTCQQCGIICKPSERELGHILSLHDAELLGLSDLSYLNKHDNLVACCMSCNASQSRQSMSPKFYSDWITSIHQRPMLNLERELHSFLKQAERLHQ